ncbi:GNAT family N-acetyltransferase [Streptomyces nitrosporeus]|uniref:GNAT family N-acetyltransferase n=1 Tax=Streptomyces nitrosporeus TaxID=28894 RepID=UPI00167DDE92|nr:GNAT family N-acetyltransferase [Streptomyces nitrosporeus]GGZ20047.1 UPF0256 protein [Streptomyces nitrosporeus]
MALTIRSLTGPEELLSFDHARALAFGHPLRRSIKPGPTMELDRMHLALEGGHVVGTAAAASFTVSLPGGSTTPCAGIRWVSTLPTHRRRGVLSALVRHQLDDFRKRGEAVAVLWASQAAVYTRYGFGLATTSVDTNVTPRAPFLPVIAYDPVHYADTSDLTGLLGPIYRRAQQTRPGLLSRSEGWWQHLTADPETRWVIHQDANGIEGYLAYQPEPEGWTDSGPSQRLHVVELISTTPRAEASLWRFALDLDLTSTITAKRRPTDDALPWMLADVRHARHEHRDGMWLRIIDLPAALTARTLSTVPEAALRIQVADATCPWNDGTWSLGTGTCTRTTAAPDVSLDTADLASCYLGAESLTALAHAGRVVQHTSGGIARLATMLGTDRAPWAVTWF